MRSPIVLSSKAEQQLEDIAVWWAKNRSPKQAQRWHAGFVRAITSLVNSSSHCPLAAENAEFPFEIRELRYGLGAMAWANGQRIERYSPFGLTWFTFS